MLFERNYGVDLGDSSVRIYSALRNKSYTEKNMIAARGREIIAVGDKAYEMYEKVPNDVSVRSPMAFGMISDVELEEIVLYTMLGKIDPMLKLGGTFYFSVPLDMTAVERRAYYSVVNGHWLHQNRVYMVEGPIADALAIGINLHKNVGSMVVNIGGQNTNLSIIADGKIIIRRTIPMGGRQMNEAIVSEIRRRHHLQIGFRTGQRLKLVMGRLKDPQKEARRVVGIDSVSGLPREEIISSAVVNDGITNCVNEIAQEMKSFLERTPPQISYQIAKEGIYLTGGSARLPFIDQYLSEFTGVTVNQTGLYEASQLNGLIRIIRDTSLRSWVQPIRQRKI